MKMSYLIEPKTLWKCSEMGRLREDICVFVESRLTTTRKRGSRKILTYFKRAFTRWVFNCVKNGLNPFLDRITAADLVQEADFDYFYFTNLNYHRAELDWSWLDERLLALDTYEPPMCRAQVDVHIYKRDTDAILSVGDVDLVISKAQYKACSERYQTHTVVWNRQAMHQAMFLTLYRYNCMGLDNNHCSAPPNLIKYTMATVELFGSPFNATLDRFCSAFPDLEKDFGSIGSFFDLHLHSGVYFMNPPYDETLMEESVQKVLSALNSDERITVILVLPLWDSEKQVQVRGEAYVQKKFGAYRSVSESQYLQSETVCRWDTHKFFDYYKQENVPVCDSHLCILTNTFYPSSATMIADEWARIVAE